MAKPLKSRGRVRVCVGRVRVRAVYKRTLKAHYKMHAYRISIHVWNKINVFSHLTHVKKALKQGKMDRSATVNHDHL